MIPAISPIIKPAELIALNQTTPFIIVDARAGGGANEQYLDKHLKGALYVDLELQLADKKPDAANGGRHPLPEPHQFAKVLTGLGITPESHVIIYDDKNGSNAAARLWWMLKAAGHEKVQVLDGGLDAGLRAGFPSGSGEEAAIENEPYQIGTYQLPTADMTAVANAAGNTGHLVIDVRDAIRFRGEKEPIDLIAGHIPGAVNIPFTGNLDEHGFFLPPSVLKQKYSEAINQSGAADVIVHCGSGVTACHTILAMAYAEMEIPTLYVGSWSEWSRNDKPIGTGE